MTLELYYNASERNQLDKNIFPVTNLDVHPVEGFSIEDPVLKIGSVDFSVLSNANYAYIPEYNRYYFIDPPTIANNKIFMLSLHVDVLMSFKSSIRNLVGIISRQENQYNLYLPDPEFKVYANTDKKTLKFSKSPFTKTANFLLTVSGGT